MPEQDIDAFNEPILKLEAELSPAAREACDIFKSKIVKRKEELKQKVEFFVVVLGPGKGAKNVDLLQKRFDIAKAIDNMKATPVLPETIIDNPGDETSLDELLQMMEADCIIALPESRGAASELQRYGWFDDIIGKTIAFFPEKAKGTFDYTTIADAMLKEGKGVVEGYEEQDLIDCHLIGKACKFVDKKWYTKCSKEILRTNL